MLVQFSVENFRSIANVQELSMVASPAAHKAGHSISVDVPGAQGLKLLRTAVIYGPNAAGKSNLCRALTLSGLLVRDTATERRPVDRLPVTPHLGEPGCRDLPSRFSFVIIAQQQRYDYTFAVTAQAVHHESLVAYPNGRAQKWFERNLVDGRSVYKYSRNHFNADPSIEKKTRPNALYLSTAVQWNDEQLLPVYEWFGDTLRQLDLSHNYSSTAHVMSEYLKSQPHQHERIAELLRMADSTIKSIEVTQKKLEPSDFPEWLREAVEKNLGEDADTIYYKIRASHFGEERFTLDFEEESGGTRKLFELIGPWLLTKLHGLVGCFDEIETSLHPLLVRQLVRLCLSPHGMGQYILFTHATDLLRGSLLHRDEIWFCEKDRNNQTQLYPLSDYRTRSGEALEKNYKSGKYGAIPVESSVLSTWNELVSPDDADQGAFDFDEVAARKEAD